MWPQAVTAMTSAVDPALPEPLREGSGMRADRSDGEPSGNSPWGGPSKREGRARKRDDYGVQLFRRALDSFADLAALRHALLELTRSYNPVTNGPILDAATRYHIIQLVEAGEEAGAHRLLAQQLDAFAQRGAER